MKKFQYQILRFQPDRVSGEFVNVGLVMFSGDLPYLKAKSVKTISRVKHLFPKLAGNALQVRLRKFAQTINETAAQRTTELKLAPATEITQLTYAAIPQDDSALYWSDVKVGMDVALDVAFNDLFGRLITRHLKESPKPVSDAGVWKTHYKQYFDREELRHQLKTHTIKTKGNNTIEFEKAIKNGVWHCMEPVAFNLSTERTVKEKVYRWMGKLQELEDSDEKFRLYLLTQLPEQKELRDFIYERLKDQPEQLHQVEIVTPDKADDFVQGLVETIM